MILMQIGTCRNVQRAMLCSLSRNKILYTRKADLGTLCSFRHQFRHEARSHHHSFVALCRCYSSRSRNNLLREKTKAIRSNVLEVIYGGQENIPRGIIWERSQDVPRLDQVEDFREVIDNEYRLIGIEKTSLVKQRAFFKESKEYQWSSLEYINVIQEEYTATDDEDAKRLLRLLEFNDSLFGHSPKKILKYVNSLMRLPPSRRGVKYESSGWHTLGDFLCKTIGSMTTEQFVRSLLLFYWLEIPLKSHWNMAIEKECLCRISSWDVNTLFLVTDWWICKSGATSWAFHHEMLIKLKSYWTKFTPCHTVQAFYLCGQYKRPAQDLVEKLTFLAERIVHELSLSEIAAICNGHIKLAGRLPHKSILPMVVSSALSHNMQLQTNLDYYNVVTIMRFLGRSYYYDRNLYHKVAENLKSHISQMNPLAPPHIAAVYARSQCLHKPLFHEILKCFDHSRANLKDYYLMLWSFCRLNHQSAEFDKFVDHAVARIATEEQWTRDAAFMFVKVLLPLSFIGKYPNELLNRAFSPAYLKNYKGRCPNDVYRHLYCVDCSLALECPEYNGHRLPKTLAKLSNIVPHGSTRVVSDEQQEYAEIIRLLADILGGQQYLQVHPILDHIRTPVDIEVHLDNCGKPLDLTSKVKGEASSTKKIAVLVGPLAHYQRDSKTLLGVHVMKRRQLKLAGYHAVEIPYFEWEPVRQSSKSAKRNYLYQRLFNS